LSFEEEGLLYIPEIDWLKNEVMGNRQSDALKKIDCLGGLFIPTYMLTY
jgi:hypothetical protein